MLLKVHKLAKFYEFKRHLYLKSEQKAVFENVSFELNLGENLLLCGQSGCGKSTLGKIIAMLEKASSGEVFFEEKPILKLNFKEQRRLRKEISYVFQEQKLALNPYKKVLDLLCVGSENFGLKFDLNESKRLFEDFELEFSLTKLKPKELSTGQAQRIGLIRALLLRPKLLILDEITAPLDLSASGKILSHLLNIQKKQDISYIFISHETGLFKPHCAQILQMNFLQNQA